VLRCKYDHLQGNVPVQRKYINVYSHYEVQRQRQYIAGTHINRKRRDDDGCHVAPYTRHNLALVTVAFTTRYKCSYLLTFLLIHKCYVV